jgi:Zn-dependent M28 family amino/carboxypeptidase
LLGAHYDTVPGCPGANDNTSGVAALLELSRLFASVEPALTVRFVAFVNEEPPYFLTGQQGSVVYAKAARQRGDDIRLINRDHRMVQQ